ncbi:DUF4382 domain-containing protein [Geofilum rubicundum]|uniref:Probable lipoprotein n=1 Tax=Geofilum rubicundum JCM 15548 TaxID=1236989 RepID=A0A0E9LWP0_9BACT|nr:DUF4382 domain-containing protein [Geofilum rubicundum]GAO29669.1 probable lipoprotein [Geofilum rubicundum JCM 15548]
MKNIFGIMLMAFTLIAFTACEESEKGKGTLNLAITDAPIDTDGISGVYITVVGLQYHSSADGWVTIEDFEGPATYDLLALTRGEFEMLGNFELNAGHYSQLRFMLDATEYGQGAPTTSGAYIEFDDGSTSPLFVPSGSQSGFKAVGAFSIPVNGEAYVTADFDVRKSIVKTGMNDRYILKPVIRLVVDNQAGSIEGHLSGIEDEANYVVYAYAEGSYTEDEAAEPEEEMPRFPNAVSSDVVDVDDYYHIAFLAEGSYDLVVVRTTEEGEVEVIETIENVEVESKTTTTLDIALSLNVVMEI